jgi:hypothetical protein
MNGQINTLLQDELLKDVNNETTIKHLKDLIAIEKGKAFRITINRSPLPSAGMYYKYMKKWYTKIVYV